MADTASNLGSPHANVPPSPAAGVTSPVPGSTPAAPAGTVAPDPNAADTKVSPKLQMLMHREKEALKVERSAKTREEKVAAREKVLEAREAKITEFESVKATNPRKALELLGMTYQDLTMAELNDGTPTPDLQVKNLEGKLDTLRKELTDKDRAVAERAKTEAQAAEAKATEDFKTEIASYIDANPDACELIKFEGQRDLVFAVINTHYERTIDANTGVGKVMTIAEAAEKVEKFLDFKYQKALELKKFQTRVVPAKPLVPKPQNPTGQKPQARTLSNGMSGNSGAPKTRILTDEERVQKAVAYARGLRPQG